MNCVPPGWAWSGALDPRVLPPFSALHVLFRRGRSREKTDNRAGFRSAREVGRC